MGIVGLISFERSIDAAKLNIRNEDWPTFVRKLGLQLIQLLVFGTPVDTGETRGAWVVTVSAPSGRNPSKSRRAAGAIREARNVLGSYSGFRNVYATNNKAWIGELERGSSSQAPGGILEPAILFLGHSVRQG